jgi:hypothetical protein
MHESYRRFHPAFVEEWINPNLMRAPPLLKKNPESDNDYKNYSFYQYIPPVQQYYMK